MKACCSAAVMGSVQQPVWKNGSGFSIKGSGMCLNPDRVRIFSVRACRATQLEGSLVTGRSSSSVSVQEIGCKYSKSSYTKENCLCNVCV